MATNESVRVMVRFRPTNKSEQKKAASTEPWATLQATDKGIKMNGNELTMHNIEEHGQSISYKHKKEKFYFDALMPYTTTQVEAFECVAQQICDEIIQGYNGTIFVYGQSGSGKTHTMYGPEEKKDSMDINEMGVIPQSCAYIFQILNNKDHPLMEGMLNYNVQCEFVEIYNEVLKDLLDLTNKPQIRQICVNVHKDEWRVITKNVQRRQVRNLGEVLKAIRYASSHRTVAGTNLNATSSRSHMVMRLIVKIETADGVRTGIGNFSDLAGSEKVKKTGAKGKRLKEAQNILLSLSTLSRVIEALVKRKLPPFQDSKLTFMLKDSLGGNCKTALLIAASPHVFNRDETVRSLQFGERCRKIQNKAKINAIKTKAQLIQENEALKKQIEALKSKDQDFVLIDDAKSMEKEKQKYQQKIEELGQLNQKLSDQLQEMSEQKELNDEYHVKIHNDYEQLVHQHKELKLDLDERNNLIFSFEKQISDFDGIKERLSKQNDELSITTKKINQTNQSLNIENERLREENEEQINDINKLKDEYDRIQKQQKDLQNKWKSELDSKKSQFSSQEMQLQQNIESLQLQIEQRNQTQHGMKRELNENNQKIKKQQIKIHDLQDENRKIINNFKEEKEKNVGILSENETLKIQIKELLSQLNQEKLKNEGVDLKLKSLKETHRNELQEQQSKINDLEIQVEMKSNQIQSKQNIIHEMKKEHNETVNNLKFEMEALTNLNEQLQEENKTAINVVDDHKDQLQKHRRQITNVQEENIIIQKQLNQLQSYYSKVIQNQIEADEKYAREMQRKEHEKYIQKQREKRKKREKQENKKGNVKLSGVEYQSDESDDDLLPGNGQTAGGPAQFEKEYMEQFSDKEEEEEEEEEDISDDNKGDESEDDEEYEDIEDQQKAMFGAAIERKKRESLLGSKNIISSAANNNNKNNNDDLEATMRLIQQMRDQDMMQIERQQKELQERQKKDAEIARSIYNNQERLHNKAWDQYGVPVVDKMEKEKQKNLNEKQRKKEEKQRKYIEKHFISAEKIGDDENNDDNDKNNNNSKNKKKKDKKKRKQRQGIQDDDEQQNQYLDPNDGMGLVIMDSDDAEY